MRKKQNYQWDKLSIGTCYYPEHWDKSLWKSDLERMLANGVETIRIAEFAWTIFEPEESVFSFDFFDEFLDVAEQTDIKVIFCTPTAIPPVWMSEKYPEILNCRKDGVLYRHGMRRHFNYNSATLHRLASEAVEKIAEHYAGRKCIVGWQIDNELNCEISEYYSESDTLAFRAFLKDKYNTLDALNSAWGTVFWNQTYTAWEQVYVPRTTINDHTNPHQMMDFKRFISESTIRFCRMQSDILRKYVKTGDFITTNSVFQNVDNHRMSDECLDVHTYDCYPNFAYSITEDPAHCPTLNDRKWSMHLAGVRSICPHFGIMEQQSGPGGWNVGMQQPAPKPGQLTLWAMNSVAHGADYVSFFRWRTAAFGTEMYWHGILDYDNCDTRRLSEVRALSERFDRISETTGASYVAQVALVKDYDNIFDAQVDKWHGMVTDASEPAIYQTAQLSHTPMDILQLMDSTEAQELERYSLLFCPHAEILTERMVRLFDAYVRNGGTLVIGARTGQKDIDGHCPMTRMPGLLSPLTQSVVEQFTVVGPDDSPVRMYWDGRDVETGGFNDILAVNGPDARILATYKGSFYYDGKPALIETRVGKGRILHFGGVFTRENTRMIMNYAGVLSPYRNIVEAPNTCEIALKEKDGQRWLFVLNFNKRAQGIQLHRCLIDMDTGDAVEGTIQLKPFDTKVYKII